MLDIEFIKQNKEIVKKAIKDRNLPPISIDSILDLYKERKSIMKEIEDINKRKKEAAEKRDTDTGKMLKERGGIIEKRGKEISQRLTDLLSQVPNIPLPDVPIGKDEEDNVVLKQVGEKKTFSFTPLSHWELGEKMGVIDIKNAAKVCGSRFSYIKGDLVLLQMGIINFALEKVMDTDFIKEVAEENNIKTSYKPFIPVLPPTMILPKFLFGVARLEPREDKFFMEKDNLFLVGSAEHTLASMHAGDIIDEKDLPIRYIGYSSCYRREAGSYGKDTKGILRQHQFDKLEMESFTVPEGSRVEQDLLVGIQENLLKKLELPYQVVFVSTGDMGIPDQRQIDMEVWMPSENKYRETHSADLTGGYQSRRLSIKVKRSEGKKEILHLNDATLFAIGRMFVAILENNQTEDGKVLVPQVLQKYVGKEYISSI